MLQKNHLMTTPGRTALLAMLACILIYTGAGASTTPSHQDDMPAHVESLRDEILGGDGYVSVEKAWREYLALNPESAIARVEIARAIRYGRGWDSEERKELIREALAIDPECPEALDEFTGIVRNENEGTTADKNDRVVTLLERAVKSAPRWPVPHFGLWSACVLLGRVDQAEDHLRALIEKGAFPPPLLDFGYNMLMSAAPNAIVFTNGDNDTYPPLALQAAAGIRPDVSIINLSLLNIPEYAIEVFPESLGDESPFSKDELERIEKNSNTVYKETGRFRAGQIVEALLEKLRQGEYAGPVSFALTVTPSHLDNCGCKVELEGLLWRVTDRAAGPGDSIRGIDGPRTLRLYQSKFRMDSATDLGFRWTPTSAVRMIVKNYPALLSQAAEGSAEEGDLEGARYALREAIRLLEFHGEKERVVEMAEYWKELDPENAEPDRWLTRK